MMSEFFIVFTQEIYGQLVTGLVGLLVAFLTALAYQGIHYIKSEIARKRVADFVEMIGKNVVAVNNAYVDELKELGKFDEEAHIIAFNKSMEKTKNLMTADLVKLIEDMYNDVDEWIKSETENQVTKAKEEKEKLEKMKLERRKLAE